MKTESEVDTFLKLTYGDDLSSIETLMRMPEEVIDTIHCFLIGTYKFYEVSRVQKVSSIHVLANNGIDYEFIFKTIKEVLNEHHRA